MLRRALLLTVAPVVLFGCFSPTTECDPPALWQTHTLELDGGFLVGMAGNSPVVISADRSTVSLVTRENQLSSWAISASRSDDDLATAIALGDERRWMLLGRNKMFIATANKATMTDSLTLGAYVTDIGLDWPTEPILYWYGYWRSLSAHTAYTQADILRFSDDWA